MSYRVFQSTWKCATFSSTSSRGERIFLTVQLDNNALTKVEMNGSNSRLVHFRDLVNGTGLFNLLSKLQQAENMRAELVSLLLLARQASQLSSIAVSTKSDFIASRLLF